MLLIPAFQDDPCVRDYAHLSLRDLDTEFARTLRERDRCWPHERSYYQNELGRISRVQRAKLAAGEKV